ncbi:MAG: hypothetical protein KF777_10315 [Planctomycetaceae bacterium]|nr:hypothetical protein [Planctomycetaceae bacterium]
MSEPRLNKINSDLSVNREALIRQLIAGSDVEEIVVYDVSDCQLYGRRYRQKLRGDLARAAEDAECEPVVYQSVYWFTLAYFPFKPLGTYLVLPRKACDDPGGDADQYRAVRLATDWCQVAVHYLIAVLLLVTAVLSVLAWQRFRSGSGFGHFVT